MQLDILLFAGARQAADCDQVSVNIAHPATVADVLAALDQQHPSLRPLLPSCRLAVDCTYVDPDQVIPSGSEVALIPPVSGG
jgi:molybdopterin converting factor subunit 1